MYDIVGYTPKDIVIGYVIFLSACAVTYPIVNLLITTVSKGANRWR